MKTTGRGNEGRFDAIIWSSEDYTGACEVASGKDQRV